MSDGITDATRQTREALEYVRRKTEKEITNQPQQEYIITEDDLESLYAMTHTKYEQQVTEIHQRVHSRPHTSHTPAADQKAPICENCGLDNTSCRMDMAGCLQAQNAAAKAATEKVLEDLKADLKTRFVSSSNQWCKGRNSGLIECCNIIDESLRAQQGNNNRMEQ